MGRGSEREHLVRAQARRQASRCLHLELVLRFRQAFWNERSSTPFEFLHAPNAAFLTFRREQHGRLQQITAWAGDPEPDLVNTGPELLELVLGTLARLLDTSSARAHGLLISAHHHDFARDPFAQAAYAFARPGGGGAHAQLAQSIDDTLFFAGEATDSDFPATVPGALASGERAARALLGT